jgi:hypothetical protein
MFASCLDHGQVATGCFKVVLVFVASVQSIAEVDQFDIVLLNPAQQNAVRG